MGPLKHFAARHRRLLAVLLAAVLAALLTHCLHNSSTWYTGNWDETSQELVFGRLLQMQLRQHAPGGFLGTYAEGGDTAENRYLFRDGAAAVAGDYKSYAHQTGLQGTLLGAVNRALLPFIAGGEAREVWLYALNSWLFYMVTLALCAAVWRAWGALPALAWLAAAVLAPWVQTGMKNLYWCLWLWWLPALAGVLLCIMTNKKGRTPGWCHALLFAAVLLRCLCGFEFISVYLILSEIPLVYCWAKALARGDGAGAKRWFCRMVPAGVAGVGGVAAALGVWLVQGRFYFGSWAASLANITEAAGSRMSVSDAAVQATTVPAVLHKYIISDATPLLQLGGVGVPLPALAGACLAALAVTAAVLAVRDRAALRRLLPAVCVWVLSFAAPVSWLVLSKAHADIHTHLIPILWHFGFVPVSCALLAWLLCTVLRALRREG